MDQSERRRQRLAQMLDLAQNYRGWTRKELARALGRDPTKLIPGSGVPKLDLVIDLSKVLDWGLEDVVSYFWGPHDDGDLDGPDTSFEELDSAARDAHRAGGYGMMVELAQRAFNVAATGEERARASNREAGGWDGLGRYQNVLKCIQRGLRQHSVTGEYRRMLQSNLATAYYSVWSLLEAKAIAADLLEWFSEHEATTLRDRKTRAFAHYVAGHTARRLLCVEPDRVDFFARRGIKELTRASELYLALADETGDESLRGIARTCDGGRIEAEAAIGVRSAQSAIDELLAWLDDAHADGIREDASLVGDRLESLGWWCIFGCNIALRGVTNEMDLQQYMAILTNKADEIAEELDNWAMRERVFTMEHTRWERSVGSTGLELPRVIDEEEVRVITGTMARFPTFRDTGWQILESARVISAS